PFPGAERHFAEGRHDAYGQSVRLRDDLGRGARSLERTRVDGSHGGAGQRASHGRALLPPYRGQRNVPRAGEPPLPNRLRFPMSHYEEPQAPHNLAILSRFSDLRLPTTGNLSLLAVQEGNRTPQGAPRGVVAARAFAPTARA